MSDGVAITAGSGTTIATDDAGASGHVQINKLAISTDGSATLIPATSDGLAVLARPETSGGLIYTSGHVVAAASTNATSLKGSAGQLYGYMCTNEDTNWHYLKFYNKASSPTVGSDTVVFAVGIPPGGGANAFIPHGIAFGTGIAFCIIQGVLDSSSTSATASKVNVNILYK